MSERSDLAGTERSAAEAMTHWAPRVDPELREVLPLLVGTGGDLSDPVAARRWLREMFAAARPEVPGADLVETVDIQVPGIGTGPAVPARVYRPKGSTARNPAVLWIYGGGFVLGDIDMDAAQATQFAVELGAVVVTPEYRLAPEHPFPAGLEDCMAALHWIAGGRTDLGWDVDLDRIAVGGMSAGGGLAAAVALRARDEGGPRLRFQLLGIPELDDRLETPSMREFGDTPMWNRARAEISWRSYLGTWPCTEVSPYAAPARATDLAGLPPAYVSTCELDPLRDEGICYALAMLQAGVPVELHHFPGTFHGSAMVTGAAVSMRAAREVLDAMRRGIAG